jgi:hypothetical protein
VAANLPSPLRCSIMTAMTSTLGMRLMFGKDIFYES